MSSPGSNGGFDPAVIGDLRSRAGDLLRSYRRWIAAALSGIAVIAGVSAARPSPQPTVAIWVAAHDLAGGNALSRSDVALRRVPPGDVPAGILPASHSPVGRLLAAPVRRGEPLTDVRLLSPALLARTGSGTDLAVPVRVSDGAAALALVQAGNTVDVIATNDTAAAGAPVTAMPVVEDVRVLAVPDHTNADGGGLIIVAANSADAAALARIPVGDRVSVALRRAP